MYVIDCVDCSVFSVHVLCVYADLSESHNLRAIGDTTNGFQVTATAYVENATATNSNTCI